MTELVIRTLLCFEWFNPIADDIKRDAAQFGFEVVEITDKVPEGEVADWKLTLRGTPEQLNSFAEFYRDEDGPLEFEEGPATV